MKNVRCFSIGNIAIRKSKIFYVPAISNRMPPKKTRGRLHYISHAGVIDSKRIPYKCMIRQTVFVDQTETKERTTRGSTL